MGDEITVFPSGRTSKIKQIDRYGKAVQVLREEENGTLILADEIDLSRGSSILGKQTLSEINPSKEIKATLCWMQNQPLNYQQKYLLQQGVQLVQTKAIADINSTTEFELNTIGDLTLKLSQEILNTSYQKNNKIGRFILIDPLTNNTAAAGFIHE